MESSGIAAKCIAPLPRLKDKALAHKDFCCNLPKASLAKAVVAHTPTSSDSFSNMDLESQLPHSLKRKHPDVEKFIKKMALLGITT